jgi:hypothetical protein
MLEEITELACDEIAEDVLFEEIATELIEL